MALTKAQLIDLNGNELILDLDADTSITADTDDQIDIKIAGADDFRFTANTFTALSGSTIAAQALTATTLTTTGAIAIANDGNIGSAGDADSIAISSAGVVTFSQSPVFPDGSLAVVDLDIDGATDIGAAIVDADLFIIDDGAGGTNRKTTAARIKTYIGSSTAADDLTIGDAAVTLSTSSGNITIDATAGDSDIIFKGTDDSSDITMLTLDGSAAGAAIFNSTVTTTGLVIGSTAVTTTPAELNLIDGGATVGTTAIADGDGLLINDAGTMRVSTVQTLSAYLDDEITSMPNLTNAAALVTVSALDTGSITPGFGAIDNGAKTIRSATITAETAFVPDAQDGAALGTTSLQFSDLFLADGAVIGMGDDNEVTLTHVHDTGLLLSSTDQLQFGDSGTYIHQSADGVLDLVSDTEIEINATTIDINGNVEISGTATTTGVHTFSAAPVFPDGSIAVADLDIDGATDIGAAVVDADLFIIDDGAGGTNRKVTAARIKTYAGVSGDVTTIDSLLKADIKIGEDDQTKIDFETADEIHFYAANVEQVYLADNIFGPQSDSDVDLGTTGVRWKDAFIDTITTTGTVTTGGNIITPADSTVGNGDGEQIAFNNTADTVTITSGGNAAMVLNTAGIVTKPLQPSFLVSGDGSSTINVALGHTMFNSGVTERYDKNADFASGSFTAPVTGTYLITFGIAFTNYGAGELMHTKMDASNRDYYFNRVDFDNSVYTDTFIDAQGAQLVDMDANDTVKMVKGGDNQTNALSNDPDYTFLAGALIC